MPASAIRTLWNIGPKRSSRGDVEVERSQGRTFLWPLTATTNRQGSKGGVGRAWVGGRREGEGRGGGREVLEHAERRMSITNTRITVQKQTFDLPGSETQ